MLKSRTGSRGVDEVGDAEQSFGQGDVDGGGAQRGVVGPLADSLSVSTLSAITSRDTSEKCIPPGPPKRVALSTSAAAYSTMPSRPIHQRRDLLRPRTATTEAE